METQASTTNTYLKNSSTTFKQALSSSSQSFCSFSTPQKTVQTISKKSKSLENLNSSVGPINLYEASDFSCGVQDLRDSTDYDLEESGVVKMVPKEESGIGNGKKIFSFIPFYRRSSIIFKIHWPTTIPTNYKFWRLCIFKGTSVDSECVYGYERA